MTERPYAPDDARFDLATLEFLRSESGANLRAAITALPDSREPTVAEVARLRKAYPADAVRVALVLGAIQDKGRAKFPALPYVWSPPEALEQATSTRVARHKAERFAAALPRAKGPTYDLCCGIGGDTLALADVAPVTAVDLSAARLACLRYNAEDLKPVPRFTIATHAEDVATLLPKLPTDALVHIDPARRSGGKRTPEYADMQPGPALLEVLIHRAAGVAIKLSPAVDFDSLPPGHLELISDHGSVVQAVLWTGRLAFADATERTATILPRVGGPWNFTGMPSAASVGTMPPLAKASSPRLCLYELDGALTRAGLAGPFCARHALEPLTPDGGYALSADFELAGPALAAFSVIAIHPFSERRIAQGLQQLPAEGPPTVEVKTRGRLPGVETDHLQVAWSRAARGRYTVLIFRHGKEVYAAIARRRQ